MDDLISALYFLMFLCPTSFLVYVFWDRIMRLFKKRDEPSATFRFSGTAIENMNDMVEKLGHENYEQLFATAIELAKASTQYMDENRVLRVIGNDGEIVEFHL